MPHITLLLVATLVQNPKDVAQSLFSADSSFAAAAARLDPPSAISAMLASGAMMPGPAGRHFRGKDEVVAALRTALGTATRVEWTPIRVALAGSLDHGITYGYQAVRRDVGEPERFKYIAYWIRGDDGWRVAVYRRTPSAAGQVPLDRQPDLLPPAAMKPAADQAALRASLAQAESQFSAEAQQIGLGPAFAKFGRPDAVNMGGPAFPAFVVGAQAIAKVVGGSGEAGSPVSWGADTVLVAPSGDLGISIGVIRSNSPPTDGRPGRFSFFTVWYRTTISAPWRYLAE